MDKLNAIKILIEEHKTIQIMIRLLEKFVKDSKNFEKIDLKFYNKTIDFFKTYVDECHHGKEEKILFSKLNNKPLKDNEKKILNELLEEHVLGRKYVRHLNELKDSGKIDEISHLIKKMIDLYKMHIHKENDVFFYPAFQYFSDNEKNEMLKEFIYRDRNIIHEKYLEVVKNLSNYLIK